MVRPRGHTVHYVPSSSLLLNKPVEFESVLAAQNSKASKGLRTLPIAGLGQNQIHNKSSTQLCG